MATLLEQYRRNETGNEHTKNAQLLAVAYGDGLEQDEAARHVRFHKNHGYQSAQGVEFQARMSKKYFHLLRTS